MRSCVFLVRHGQSEWNLRRLTQGQTVHPALTVLGRSQAAAAAAALALDLERTGATAARVVTSDLVRALETARVLARRLGVEVELDPRLREQHLGRLEGRGYEETWAAAAEHDWSDPTLPVAGGESVAQVRDRMVAALEDLDGPAPVVLVSHGDAIRAAVAHLLGDPPSDPRWVEVPNGAVARVDAGGLTWLDVTAGPDELPRR